MSTDMNKECYKRGQVKRKEKYRDEEGSQEEVLVVASAC